VHVARAPPALLLHLKRFRYEACSPPWRWCDPADRSETGRLRPEAGSIRAEARGAAAAGGALLLAGSAFADQAMAAVAMAGSALPYHFAG